MNEEPEKQKDTGKHLLDKLPIGDVIKCSLLKGAKIEVKPLTM